MSFFSRKATGVLGIDITSTAVKLVELSGKPSAYALAAFATVPLPIGAVVENTIVDEDVVIKTLIDVVRVSKSSARDVALSVSGNTVIIKVVSMPLVDDLELEDMITYEAEQYIPYDIDDVFIDFFVQGASIDEPDMIDVVLVACKRDVVEAYRALLLRAGLNLVCVDCNVFALENAAELSAPITETSWPPNDKADVRALVNVGSSMMNINVLVNGRMMFVRDQFFGGQSLTEDIRNFYNLSFSAAEQMKIENIAEVSVELINNFYTELTSELIASLDFYSSGHEAFPVKNIFLSGGSAQLPGIAAELEQRTGITTTRIQPFSRIDISSKRFDRSYLQEVGVMLMVPVGLAMRGFDT